MIIGEDNNIRVLTEADLRRIVSEVVVQAIKETSQQPKKPEPDRYLDKKEVAEMVGVSVSTVDNLRRHGVLKSYNVRRRVKFRLKEVQAYLER